MRVPCTSRASTVRDRAASRDNAQFASFVADTDCVTAWERALDLTLYPGLAEGDLQPGGMVFRAAPGPVGPAGLAPVVGVGRRGILAAPARPRQRPVGRSQHPVVQVSVEDAQAYATRRCARH